MAYMVRIFVGLTGLFGPSKWRLLLPGLYDIERQSDEILYMGWLYLYKFMSSPHMNSNDYVYVSGDNYKTIQKKSSISVQLPKRNTTLTPAIIMQEYVEKPARGAESQFQPGKY